MNAVVVWQERLLDHGGGGALICFGHAAIHPQTMCPSNLYFWHTSTGPLLRFCGYYRGVSPSSFSAALFIVLSSNSS